MHVDNFDALRIWLTKVLTHICEAEPATLSKYVCILVKKDVKGRDPKGFFTEQLEVFLQDETSGFIDKLFKALESKEYMSEEILSELNERKEKKDKKRTKSEKTDKIEKSDKAGSDKLPHHRHHRQISRHSQSSTSGSNNATTGTTAGCTGDAERHSFGPSQRQSGPSRHRTPSPAPRRHRQPKSRSRSPVHRRRRESREGHERSSHTDHSDIGNVSLAVSNANSPTNLIVPSHYDAGHGQQMRSQNAQLPTPKVSQQMNPNIISITPLMSAATTYTPQPKSASAMGQTIRVGSAPNTNVGYTPSVVPPPRTTRERCRDFDEKGFCMRGDLCPFDHGVDPVVVENVNLSKVLAFPSSPTKPAVETPTRVAEESSHEQNHDQEEQEEISKVQPQDRGRPRPVIVRPQGNVSRNIVEVPLVDDHPETRPAVNEKTDDDSPKDNFEWRGSRFGSNSNGGNTVSESSCVDLRSKLGSARTSRGGGGNFRGRRGFLSSRLNFGGRGGAAAGVESCSLGVTQIPPELNAIGPLNSHFSQFGEVMNIQIAFGGDPRNALVTFKTSEDALKAYRSPEPILSNRFIRTYMHTGDSTGPTRGRGRGRGRGLGRGLDFGGNRVPVKRRLGYGCGDGSGDNGEEAPSGGSNPKRRLHHRQGRNFDESSSESDDDWGVPEQDLESRRHVTISDSNGDHDEMTAEGLSMQEALEEARRKEEVAQRQEAAAQMRAQQLQALEQVRKRKELRVQQVTLHNKMREQLKFLAKKSSEYPPETPQRLAVQKVVDVVEGKLSELEKALDVDPEGSKHLQNLQRRIIETEYELYTREQNKLDTNDLKRKLADMQRRVAMMKEKAAAGISTGASLFLSRGQTKLDKRPRTLFISSVNDDVSARALLHSIGCSGVYVEKYEYLDNDKRLQLTCRSRQDAEYILNQMHHYKGKPLRIEWGQNPEKTPSISTDSLSAKDEVPSAQDVCPSGTKAPTVEDSNGATVVPAEESESAEAKESCDGGKSGDLFTEDDAFLEDGEDCEMEDLMADEYDPDYDEDFDAEFDPEFSHDMSPFVIAAHSETSDVDNDGEESGEEQNETENDEEDEEEEAEDEEDGLEEKEETEDNDTRDTNVGKE